MCSSSRQCLPVPPGGDSSGCVCWRAALLWKAAFHIRCLDPPLKRVPTGKFSCPACADEAASAAAATGGIRGRQRQGKGAATMRRRSEPLNKWQIAWQNACQRLHRLPSEPASCYMKSSNCCSSGKTGRPRLQDRQNTQRRATASVAVLHFDRRLEQSKHS